MELRVQDAAEGRASSGRVHPDVSRAAVDRSVAAVDEPARARSLAMGADPVARRRDPGAAADAVPRPGHARGRSGRAAATWPEAATFADDEVGPAFDAVLGHVERRVEARTLAADGAQRTSDLGMVLSIAVALVGNSLLQRRLRVEEVRRDQAPSPRRVTAPSSTAAPTSSWSATARAGSTTSAPQRSGSSGRPTGRASEGWRLHDGIARGGPRRARRAARRPRRGDPRRCGSWTRPASRATSRCRRATSPMTARSAASCSPSTTSPTSASSRPS